MKNIRNGGKVSKTLIKNLGKKSGSKQRELRELEKLEAFVALSTIWYFWCFGFVGRYVAGDSQPTCTGLPEAVSLRRREAEARAPFPLLPLLPWWLPFVPLLPFSGLRSNCVVDMVQKYF